MKLQRLNNIVDYVKTYGVCNYDALCEIFDVSLSTLRRDVDELEKQIKRLEPVQVRKEKALKSVRKILDVGYNGVDERLIEEVVEKVIVHEKYFKWKLNFYDETFKLKITGKGQKDCFIEEYKEN